MLNHQQEFQPPAASFHDPLFGCVLLHQAPWPGLVELIEASTEEQFRLLERMPGFYPFKGNKWRKIPAGFFVPQSLLDLGKYPGLLWGYPAEPNMTTPFGGRVLRDHQARSVTYIRQITPQREGAILGADMGLGKCTTTMQALWLDGLLDQPGIICGPLSAASAWCGPTSDATLYYGLDVTRVEGRKNIEPDKLVGHRHIFVNYDIIDAWMVWLTSALQPTWVIFDEIHLLMHATATRSDTAAKLSRWNTIQRRIGLSGTPIPKYRMDLWNPLRCVQPRQWGDSIHLFGMRYCGGRREVAAGTDDDERVFYTYDEDTNCLELRSRLAGTLLWYTRDEVQGALPELNRRVARLEAAPDELVEYHEASTNIIDYLRKEAAAEAEVATAHGEKTFDFAAWSSTEAGAISQWLGDEFDVKKMAKRKNAKGAIRLRALSTLVGLLSQYKAQKAVDELLRCYANHNHIVVFTWRRDAAAYICEEMHKRIDEHYLKCAETGQDPGRIPAVFGPVDGTMKQPQRQALAQEFAKNPCAIYVATMGAAGIAINELSAASCGIFVDLHWNPSTLTQAESRIHRDGSPHKAVEIVYLLVANTVDEMFVDHLTKKAYAAAGIKQGDLVDARLVAELAPSRADTPEESLDHICALLAEGDPLS